MLRPNSQNDHASITVGGALSRVLCVVKDGPP
jgi:hypothetical protein